MFLLVGCKNGKLPGSDARKIPYDPKERVKRNLEQGKGFRLNNMINKKSGGDFQFASANELWRASLDVIDFMPLASANYSGGMIITDWYSDNLDSKESIKIMVRFLSNEIRADGIKVTVYDRFCNDSNMLNCQTSVNKSEVSEEIKLAILKKASTYRNLENEKKGKEYRKKKPNRPGTLKN